MDSYIIANNTRININNDKDDDDIDKSIWDKLNYLQSIPQYEQKSKEWLEQRKNRIGGSESAACLGLNHYETQYNFIKHKVLTKPFITTNIIWWGNATEDVARNLYEYLYDVKVDEYGSIPSSEYSFIAASPDGIVSKYKRNNKNLTNLCGRMLEIKSVSTRKINMDISDNDIKNIVPEYYLTQIYQQLETCNLDICDFFQIKAYRYKSYREYSDDFNKNNKFKGMIIQLRPNNYDGDDDSNLDNCRFIHMPKIELTKHEQKKWYKSINQEYTNYLINNSLPHNKLFENYCIDKVLYYRIDQARCTEVRRDHELFISYIPIYSKIWDYVVYLRNNVDVLDKFLKCIDKYEKRNKWGGVINSEKTNKFILEYLESLINNKTTI